MVKITKTFGVILIVVGVVGYLSIDKSSFSGLIPAILGMALILLSQTAKKEVYFKKSMQATVLLTFLGFLGSGLRVIDGLLIKKNIPYNIVFITQVIVMFTCAVYIGLAVKYHFEARTEKK